MRVATSTVALGALCALPGFPLDSKDVLGALRREAREDQRSATEKAFTLGFGGAPRAA